jgi:hypothetical protein
VLATTRISPAPSGRPEIDPIETDFTGVSGDTTIGIACAAPRLPAVDADEGAFDADAAVEAAGDELNAQGFDVSTFTALDCGYLKINSVWATVADLTIFRNWTVDFDYHCFDGAPHDPGEMTAITLAILHDDDRGGEAARYPHLSFLFSIARAALDQGLSVELNSNDPSNAYWKITDEVTVTNPNRPERGTIRVTADGALLWRCQLLDQPRDTVGLGINEITSSIVRAIGSAQVVKCEEMCVRASSPDVGAEGPKPGADDLAPLRANQNPDRQRELAIRFFNSAGVSHGGRT